MEQCDMNKTSEQAMDDLYSTVSWSILLILVPLVTAFGLFSNSAFIVVVYREKTMHTITNIFLVNLAVADFCHLTATFSKSIGSYSNSPVYDFESFKTSFGCFMHGFLVYLCYYTSLWTIALVSIERYLAVCHPLWHRHVKSRERAFRMVAVTWLISILFASPTIPVQWNKQTVCIISSDSSGEIIHRISKCFQGCRSCRTILYSTDLLQFVTALIINVVLYSLIVRSLTKSTVRHELQNDKSATKSAHPMRNTVARMVIVNSTVFFICLTPFAIINIGNIGYVLKWFEWNESTHLTLAWVSRVLSLLNSALNPLLYNATNPMYRMVFKKVFLSLRLPQSCCGKSSGKTSQENEQFQLQTLHVWSSLNECIIFTFLTLNAITVYRGESRNFQ